MKPSPFSSIIGPGKRALTGMPRSAKYRFTSGIVRGLIVEQGGGERRIRTARGEGVVEMGKFTRAAGGVLEWSTNDRQFYA